MIKPERLKAGDTIGIIAPSRPIEEAEILPCIRILEAKGFKVKLGKNLYKRFYYSAGSAKERASDLNAMFKDKKVKAIMCATGGISSNQLLDLIDYETIKNNPKIFIGYSDITVLLLAIHKKTGLVTFHGPNLHSLKKLDKKAENFLFNMLMGGELQNCFPSEIEIIKKGKANGKLLGGNLYLNNSLLGTKYSPSYNNAIWFWEELGQSPAALDQELNQFKLSGNLEKISAMVVGSLLDCTDKKYEEDNRPIDEIILEITKGYDFPIIKVPYFGHGVSNLHVFPTGINSVINTELHKFEMIENPVM